MLLFSYHFAAVIVAFLVEICLHFRFRFSGPTLKMQVSASQLGHSRWQWGVDHDHTVYTAGLRHELPSANMFFSLTVEFFKIGFVFHLSN